MRLRLGTLRDIPALECLFASAAVEAVLLTAFELADRILISG